MRTTKMSYLPDRLPLGKAGPDAEQPLVEELVAALLEEDQEVQEGGHSQQLLQEVDGLPELGRKTARTY